MAFWKILAVVLAFLPLLGCGLQPFVQPKANPVIEEGIGSIQTVATTGERRLTYVRRASVKIDSGKHLGRFGGHDGEFCAEPSPDSIENLAAAFSLAASGSGTTPEGISKKIRGGFSSTVATATAAIFRRTQGLQLYRDGAFLLCQAMMNGYMEANEYLKALELLRLSAVNLIEIEIVSDAWKAPFESIKPDTPAKLEAKDPLPEKAP